MPRDSNGNYTLPAGNPVVTGTTIEAAWANGTMDDIKQALSDSLDRYGRGGMQAPFRFVDGSPSQPGISWASEVSTGLYRAGGSDMRASVAGVARMRWTGVGVDVWDTLGSAWVPLIGAGGTSAFARLALANDFTATPQRVVNAGGAWSVVNAASPAFGMRIGLATNASVPSLDVFLDGTWRPLLSSASNVATLRAQTFVLQGLIGDTRLSVQDTEVKFHNGRRLNLLGANDAAGVYLASDGVIGSAGNILLRPEQQQRVAVTLNEMSLESGLRLNFYNTNNANFFNQSNIGAILNWNSSVAGTYRWQSAATGIFEAGPGVVRLLPNTYLEQIALNGTLTAQHTLGNDGIYRIGLSAGGSAFGLTVNGVTWMNLNINGMYLFSKGAVVYHDNPVLASGKIVVSDQPAPGSGHPPGTIWMQV